MLVTRDILCISNYRWNNWGSLPAVGGGCGQMGRMDSIPSGLQIYGNCWMIHHKPRMNSWELVNKPHPPIDKPYPPKHTIQSAIHLEVLVVKKIGVMRFPQRNTTLTNGSFKKNVICHPRRRTWTIHPQWNLPKKHQKWWQRQQKRNDKDPAAAEATTTFQHSKKKLTDVIVFLWRIQQQQQQQQQFYSQKECYYWSNAHY